MNFEPWLPIAVLSCLCVIAGWLDATQRRLPNWLSLLTSACGLLAAAFVGGIGEMESHAFHMAVALVCGLALFALGGVGGGDAKFYAGTAAWFEFAAGLRLLTFVALAGLLLLVVWFSYRRLKGIPIRKKATGRSDSLPYGLAIGVGAIAAATL